MHLKILYAKWRPFRPGGDELKQWYSQQAIIWNKYVPIPYQLYIYINIWRNVCLV